MDSRSRRSFRQQQQHRAQRRHRRLFLEKLEQRMVLDGSPWHNALDAFDVDHDGRANAIDRSTLSNFLYRTPGRSGPVSVPASPDPSSDVVKFYDVDADLVVDDSDLSGLTDFLLGKAASGPVPPGASGPDSVEPLGEGGGEGESGPSGSPPSVWLTSFASYVVEGETTPQAFRISRSGNPSTSLTVNFTVTGAASSGDYTSAPLSAGSVTIAPFQSDYNIPLTALDDALLENAETLVVTLTPSSSYYIASGPAQTEIHDGEHGIVDTGFSVEWEDEDGWKSAPDSHTLWEDSTHRWRANIPSQLVGLVGMVTWYRRPYNNPSAPWQEFAGQEYSPSAIEYLAIGNPGIGHWDIMYRATYGLLSWFQVVEDDKPVNGVELTKWEKGHDDQGFVSTYDEVNVYPEKHHPFAFHGDYKKVKLVVSLKLPVPMTGPVTEVKLKAFDPDHEHVDTGDPEDDFDWNDYFEIAPPPGEYMSVPGDNRQTGGGRGQLGGTLADEVLSYGPGEQTKLTMFTINDAQPGNNFLAVACPIRPGEMANGVDIVHFASDGLTLQYTLAGAQQDVPTNNRTPLLTVWRTLWVELDSMTEPDPMLHGPFDANDPLPDPLNVPNPAIDLLSSNYRPAKIDVKVLPSGQGELDQTDERFFFHYAADNDPVSGANELRDIPASNEFWVIHLIGAYEWSMAEDFDDETNWLLGRSMEGTNSAYILRNDSRSGGWATRLPGHRGRGTAAVACPVA